MILLKLPTKKQIDNYLAKNASEEIIDDLYNAQNIMYDVWESDDYAEIEQLIKKALRTSPLCADAYNFYCSLSIDDLIVKNKYLLTALYAAEQALLEPIENFEGHCWGVLETRPYMRVKAALALNLWEIGDYLAAIHHLEEMLVLNPNDNQGMREILASYYLELEKTKELEQLIKQYDDDYSLLLYTKALLLYKKSSKLAEKIAREAIKRNKHVPNLLNARKKSLSQPDMLVVGGKEEAISYVDQNLLAWMRTNGAIDWIVTISSK